MDGVFETQPDRTDLPLVVMPVVIESMIGPFKQNFTMLENVARVRMYEDFTLDEDTIVERCKDADAVMVIGFHCADAILDRLDAKCYAFGGTGVASYINLEKTKERGIRVCNVLHYGDHAVAEHAMALAQAANRRICKAYIKVRNNNFALDGLLGQNFYGACAGIVGTGRIGAAMARICHGFGMNVLCYDMYKNPEVEKFARYVSLEELLQKADLVSLHCPLTEGTHHMINKDTIAMMRDSAILVNTSRGGLIDTDALIEALRARKFGGVGLDVYEDEDDQVFQDFSDDVLENEVVPVLLSFPNVVITRTALQSIAAITLENARAFARGEELKNEVKA